MLILLPVFLLLLTAAAIIILQWVRPNYGTSWLTAVGMTLGVWILLLVLKWQSPGVFTISGWRPVEGLVSTLVFQMDEVSWPYAFSLTGLLLGVILTASARMDTSHPGVWAGSIAITAAALLAVMSGNALTLILTWTVIDIVELAIFLRASPESRQSQEAVVAFAARIGGTLLVIWAMMFSFSRGSALTLTNILPESSIFLLAGAALRLGVVPLHLPYTQEVRMRRGLGTVLRLASPAAALPLLSRVPATVVPPQWAPYFLLFTTLAALYGAAMWLFARDELNGRPYWLIALAGMAVGAAIRGHPESTVAWGAALVLAGGMVFLFSARRWPLFVIPLFSLLALTGLPFTPTASGWSGLVVLPFNLLDVVTVIAHGLLLAGFLRHIFTAGTTFSGVERWVQLMYPLGLIFMAVSFWLIGIFGWPGSLTIGIWWASPFSFAIALVVFSLLQRYEVQETGGRLGWLVIILQRIGRGIAVFLRLDWLYGLVGSIYRFVQVIIQFLTQILEGAGGILWALLLLVLLFTFIRSGQP